MFVSSNPLNAAAVHNFKKDSEIGNKNIFFSPENSIYGNCRKGKVSVLILCSRGSVSGVPFPGNTRRAAVVKFLHEDPSCIFALVQA